MEHHYTSSLSLLDCLAQTIGFSEQQYGIPCFQQYLQLQTLYKNSIFTSNIYYKKSRYILILFLIYNKNIIYKSNFLYTSLVVLYLQFCWSYQTRTCTFNMVWPYHLCVMVWQVCVNILLKYRHRIIDKLSGVYFYIIFSGIMDRYNTQA